MATSLLGASLLGQMLMGCDAPAPATKTEPRSSRKATKRETSSSRTSSRQRRDGGRDSATGAAGQMNSQPDRDNSNFLLGNPSSAGKSPDNYLVSRPQYVMSYNRSKGGPNWVSWHLDAGNMGSVERGTFRPDPLLPTGWQIRPNDYRGSGFDRGHVCPSGDRTDTGENNDATFVMSNMLPQTAALNQHVWKDLEDYSRQMAAGGYEMYIVAGGIGEVGRIGKGKVAVPQACWKVIVAIPQGNNDLSRIDKGSRLIAVMMPNREGEEIENSRWPQYITTVAEIEKATGYKLLSALPRDVQSGLAFKVDAGVER